MTRFRLILDILVTLAALVASGLVIKTYIYNQGRQAEARPTITVPSSPITIDSRRAMGSPTAGIGIVEYSDLECPFCSRFALETLPQLKSRFVDSGTVVVAFKHMPLKIHKHALEAAVATQCAADQDAFWPAHDLLYRSQRTLGAQPMVDILEPLGLDGARLRQCLSTGDRAEISADLSEGAALGLYSTPTFLVGRRSKDTVVALEVITGARAFPEFEKAIKKVQANVSR